MGAYISISQRLTLKNLYTKFFHHLRVFGNNFFELLKDYIKHFHTTSKLTHGKTSLHLWPCTISWHYKSAMLMSWSNKSSQQQWTSTMPLSCAYNSSHSPQFCCLPHAIALPYKASFLAPWDPRGPCLRISSCSWEISSNCT